MKNKLFTLPIILLTVAVSAFGYYVGAIGQKNKEILVKVDQQLIATSGVTQTNKIIVPIAAPTKIPVTKTQSAAITPKKASQPVTIPKPATTIKTTPVKSAPVSQAIAPVVQTPAAVPTPTTKVS